MKLTAIIGKENGKMTKDDAYELEGIAQSTIENSSAYVAVTSHLTKSRNLKDFQKNPEGHLMHITLDSPYFLDITKFYQRLSSLKKEYGINYILCDSKIDPNKKYNASDFEFDID